MMLLASSGMMADELTQASYLERVAVMSGCPSASGFCRDFGLSFIGIRKGQNSELLRLAAISQVDPELMLANAIIEVAPRSYEIRGCHVISNMLRTDEVALCPACIGDDLARASGRRNPYDNVYLRIPWHLRAIETCLVHNCRLQRFSTKSARYECRSFALYGRDAAFQLQSGPKRHIQQSPTNFERYVHKRLAGISTKCWLDRMPLSEVTRLCEGFGHDIADNLNGDAEGVRDACNSGYSILSGGAELLKEHLRERLAGRRKNGQSSSIKSLLGSSLKTMLARRSNATTDFHLFRETIAEFVWEQFPERYVRRSMSNLAIAVPFAELQDRLGVPEKRLKFVAAHCGVAPNKEGMLDASVARALVKQATTLWPVKKVRKLLGVNFAGVARLSAGGLLGPVHNYNASNTNRKFEPEAVVTLLGKLQAAIKCSEPKKDWIAPTEAVARFDCGLDVVVRMLVSGSLQKVASTSSTTDLPSIRFCEREFFQHLLGVTWFGLSMRKAAQRLGVPFEVLAGLVRAGYLQTQRYNFTVFVSDSSLTAFEDLYVSAASLAKAQAKTSATVIRNYAKQGVNPVISRDLCGAHFFARVDLTP